MNKPKRSGFAMFALLFSLALPGGCDRTDEVKKPADSRSSVSIEETPVDRKENSRRITLNWISHWKNEDMREVLVREIKKNFEFLHPGVEVNLVFSKDLRGPEPAHKKRVADEIVKMINTGKIAWDVVLLDIAVYEHVSEKLGDSRWVTEHLVNFATVPGFLDCQKDFIAKEPRYKEMIGGMFTGPFIEGYMMNLWYNTKVAERIGIEIKERGMTFDDFLGYAEKIHLYNKANGSSLLFMKVPSWNRMDFLFENLFKSLFDDFQSAVEKTFNKKKKQAFLETLLAFEKISQFQPAVNRNVDTLPFDEFLEQVLYDDDSLFIIGGTFMYSHLHGLDKEESVKMRPVDNPYLGKPNGLVGDYTPVFAVMKNSNNRDLAVELVMSWAKPANAEKWVRYTKNLTGAKGHLSERVTRNGDYFDDIHEMFITDMEKKYKESPMMYLRTPTYVFGDENTVSVTELRSKLAIILAGDLTAREYFDDVMTRLGESAP